MLSLPLAGDLPLEIPVYDDDRLAEDLMQVSRNRLAETITGGLSRTRKMPCVSWGIPATRCKIGSVLAQKQGTVCHQCYALKGNYLRPNVREKLEERYRGLFNPLWTPAMIFLINYFCGHYFRWMDSGDVQSVEHLLNINTVARHTPDISHWLPSREGEIARQTRRRLGQFAPNLLIRLSASLVDGPPPKTWATTSTVFTVEPHEKSVRCQAPENGGECGKCRACWDSTVPDIAYQKH